MRRICQALVVLLALPGVLAEPATEGVVDDIEIVADTYFDPNVDSVVWASPTLTRSETEHLRLFFSDIDDRTDASYRIQLVGANDRLLHEYSRAKFAGSSEFWMTILNTRTVTILVLADRKPVGLSFRIRKIAYQARDREFLSVFGRDGRKHLVKVKDPPGLQRVADAVAKLSYINAASTPKTCTGFLVDTKHLVTNYHCISTPELCATAVATFGYRQSAGGEQLPGVGFDCKRLVDKSRRLDAAILELDGAPGDTFGALRLEPHALHKKDALIMIQHPNGKPKMVSKSGCRVSTPVAPGVDGDTDFGHQCDTERGSSGSPVLDLATLTVVGLHHWGFASGDFRSQNRAVQMTYLKDFVDAAITRGAPESANHEEVKR